MTRTFSGAPKDMGAVYAWRGNKEVGSGRMEIVGLTPAKVGIKPDFLAKVMTIFVSMDSMIGPAFESALSQMKAVAEK